MTDISAGNCRSAGYSRQRTQSPREDGGRPHQGMKPHVTLKTGQVHSSAAPVLIETTLGSCVSVCLFDPVHHSGGMNHILLPGRAAEGEYTVAARYGINAMEILINGLMKLGASRRKITARVFGGARMFHQIKGDSSPGKRNVEFVMNFLDLEKIPVIACDVGGENARKILFSSSTGKVFLKRLPSLQLTSLKEKETEYRIALAREMKRKTKVTLF